MAVACWRRRDPHSNELRPGYGWCVYRCLYEALAIGALDLIVLCEGNTARPVKNDIEKLLAYAPHADIVNGTRTGGAPAPAAHAADHFHVLRKFFCRQTSGSLKHIGKCTITDVGTTYKLCRRAGA